MRTIGGLAIVFCLIGAGVIGGKKFLPQYFTKHRGEKQLKLLETLSMSDKRSVALIQVDDKSFLVGNTPQQITLLANISSPLTLSTTPELALQIQPTSTALKANGDNFRSLYEVEKKQSLHGKAKAIPPDVRAQMRQLREALEHVGVRYTFGIPGVHNTEIYDELAARRRPCVRGSARLRC